MVAQHLQTVNVLLPHTRRILFALNILGLVPLLAGASHRTANFIVEAPSEEAARLIGDHAEICRKVIAKQWLGKELPNWTTPCPVKVKLTSGEALV